MRRVVIRQPPKPPAAKSAPAQDVQPKFDTSDSLPCAPPPDPPPVKVEVTPPPPQGGVLPNVTLPTAPDEPAAAPPPAPVAAPPTRWTVADVIRRVHEAVAIEPAIRYANGHGGRRPDASTPADRAGLLDCSGLVAWCNHYDRYDEDDYYWRYTDSIEADAKRVGGRRDEFDLLAEPRVGCIVVYGAGPLVGHTGICVRLPEGRWRGTPAQWSEARFGHCSMSNDARGRAVAITGGAGFHRHGAIFAWYKALA